MNGLPKDRSEVLNLINEWNSTRLDLFKISEPNEVLDFYGVMRFYFQDAEDKVTTKCIRVASTATTLDVIRVLMEKLRPDMKTLPNEKDYCIYEVHPNGDGRKLEMDERPLWVQLYWGKDQREGRFVLQNAKLPKISKPIGGSFKERRSSKRESKKKKKQDKKNGIDENDTQSSAVTPTAIGESLYKSVPETNKFTRSLSNPEMVKKIQQDRLKQKFIKISTKEGGGTMKVFGDALNPSIPYKTFLLSIKDTAEWVVKEMLEKYGLKHEDPQNYCLLQIVIPPRDQMDNKTIKEVILHDKECPLSICLSHAQKNEGSIMFKVVKCPSEYIEIRKRLRAQESALDTIQAPSIQDRTINDHLSMFVEVKNDGTDLTTPRVFKIHPNTTYVGRDAKAGTGKQYFYIDGVGIDRDHCTIHNQNGIVTLTPRGEIWLNGKLVSTPFVLQHGSLVCFGRNSTFRYCDPQFVQKTSTKSSNIIPSKASQINGDKPAIHSSLSTLPTAGMKKSNNIESNTLQVRPPKDLQQKKPNMIVESGTMIDVLPGLLEVPAETENRFLHAIFDNYPLTNIQFRLSPVYTLYMTLRHRLSPYGKPNFPLVQKQENIISLLYRIEDMINTKIEECHEHGGYLAYWIANTSELLYFIKQDRDISKISHDIQDRLAECVQRLFRYLTHLVQNELDKYLISFTNPQDDVERDVYIAFEETSSTNTKLSDLRWITSETNSNNYHQATLGDILATLSSIMDLLRKCRVNAALTIQMFSQIFHYINTWLFNRIVCCPELKLCAHFWGEKLALRLKSISDWAQRQGLELASDCHLTKVNQICLLLQNAKRDAHDVQQLTSNNTFKLNSVQIKQILNNYVLNRNESPISPTFSQALLAAAYKQVDENLRREGVLVQLAEEPELNLPFLLPEDGYTCENLRGIPQQLFEFIEPMSRSSICRLFTNPHSLGMWTEFMHSQTNENGLTNINNNNDGTSSSVETITLNKKGNSLGLSIVAAKGESQQFQGIYIKAIVPGGAAEDDGRLQAGDQILCVDKISLIDITQEQAAEALKQCGPLVALQVLKDAANRQVEEVEEEEEDNEDDIQPTAFIRSASERQSFGDRNLSTAPPLIFREDVPPTQNGFFNGNHQIKPMNHAQSAIGPTLAPKPPPKPMISTLALIKQTNPINDVDIANRLSKASLSSSSDHLASSIRKPRHQEPIKLANSRQNNISELRLIRIHDLLNKNERTDQEEKELNNLKLENEFDRRVEEFNSHTNGNDNDDERVNIIPISVLPTPSPSATDEMNEFDEKLKRRLEQYEHDRQIERAHVNRLQAKREAEIEARLRKDRDRDVRTDRDMRDLKIRRMSEEDRSIEAKKEQARLSKHVRLPDSPPLTNESMKHSSSIGHIPVTKDHVDYKVSPPAPPPPPTRDSSFAVVNNIKQSLIQRVSNDHQLISPPLPPPPPPLTESSPTSSVVAIPVSSLHAVERITAELTRRDDLYSNDDTSNHHTPSVIGSQEVYLDPRFRAKRIQQQKDNLNGINKENLNNDSSGVTTETMSFRDKLKFFRKPPDQA
ncbi:unnamed protein product [Rotaria magnacalcarata]|uniref:Afadin n=1 Tax=Rotaria magnacalcarata TaxID=392030 RepID=A0A819B564_9BILA|nr:unnamed protein product [Rotaria magnacalcarata]